MADDVHELEGIDTGRIKDSEVAHGLANKIQAGWERALKAEQVLTEELTDEQKEQLRIVESLPGKYPHAFVPDEDGTPIRMGGETGLQYLLVRPDPKTHAVVVISKFGYAFVQRPDSPFTDGELSSQDFSAVFIYNDRHERKTITTLSGEREVIEFEVKDGKASYVVRDKGQITTENAPKLKEILIARETEGLVLKEKNEKIKASALELL